MRYLPPVLALLGLFLVILLLMAWGWRRRAARQSGLTGFHALSADPTQVARWEIGRGVHVSTTLAGQPLERVTAHGLGVRSSVVVTDVLDGDRPGLLLALSARDLFIPWDAVASVHLAPGMIGKWMGGDSLAVVRWTVGGTALDTGLRLDDAAAQEALLARARELGIPARTDGPGAPGASTPSAPADSADSNSEETA